MAPSSQQLEPPAIPARFSPHLYGYAKARLTGRPPNPGENEKLDF